MKIFFAVLVGLLGFVSSVQAQSVDVNATVTFAASPDHAILASYQVIVQPASGGAAVFSRNIGKPTPDGTNTIKVPIGWTAAQFSALPAGNYVAVIRAIASDPTVTADSPASAPFVVPVQLRPAGKPVVAG